MAKATGSVETYTRADGTKYHRARIRLADGTRERVDVPEKYAYSDERRALYAAAVQEREDEKGELLAKKKARIAAKATPATVPGAETLSAFRKRLNVHRAELGTTGSEDDSAWNVWITPHLGGHPIATITREQIETFRDTLDAAIALHKRTDGAEGIGAKRALNVWSEVTTTFAAAVKAKKRELRVRTDNPCTDVLPPEKGDSRRKTFVYPGEVAAVLGCLDVALEWREAYAVASYLYLRPGELHALTWADTDCEAGVVHVTKAFEVRTGEVKAPKTANGMRDVPIPPSLVPLLRRMRTREDGTDREPHELVVPIIAGTPESKRAPKFVRALRAAGVARPRLFESTATTMPVNFRSLRDSGITWAAIAGVDVVKLQRRCGHDAISTTLDYVKQAEDLSGAIGEPFGPIPTATLHGVMGKGDEPPTSMGRRPRYQPKYRAKLTPETTKPPVSQGFLVEAAGVERLAAAQNKSFRDDSGPADPPRVDASPRTLVDVGQANPLGPTVHSGVIDRPGQVSGRAEKPAPAHDLVGALRAKAAELIIAGRTEDARKVLDAIDSLAPVAEVVDLAARRDGGARPSRG